MCVCKSFFLIVTWSDLSLPQCLVVWTLCTMYYTGLATNDPSQRSGYVYSLHYQLISGHRVQYITQVPHADHMLHSWQTPVFMDILSPFQLFFISCTRTFGSAFCSIYLKDFTTNFDAGLYCYSARFWCLPCIFYVIFWVVYSEFSFPTHP